MHEVSVISEVFEIINEYVNVYDLKRINKIVLKIGEFTCIEKSALRFAFEALSRDTICENSELVINKIRASAYCDNCKKNFNISYTNKICPECSKFSNNVVTGYELLMEKIEGE